jgi:hypothetical protein
MSEPGRKSSGEQSLDAAERDRLERRVKSGANWFYWIAALSLVNSIIVMANGQWSFILGLGVTQIVDGVSLGIIREEPSLRLFVTLVGLSINLTAVIFCAVLGVFANRKRSWAFTTGMILYGLDGLIFLTGGDFLGFAFHLVALWGISGGLRVLLKLKRRTPSAESGTAGTAAEPVRRAA